MRQTVRALVLNRRNQCLFVQHDERNPADKGKWATPGGGVDQGEDHISCLVREFREEFGVSVVDQMEVGPMLYRNTRVDRVDHFYVVWFDGVDVQVQAHEEILQHRWFTTEGVDRIQLFFGFEGELFKKALELNRSLQQASR